MSGDQRKKILLQNQLVEIDALPFKTQQVQWVESVCDKYVCFIDLLGGNFNRTIIVQMFKVSEQRFI